MKDIFGAGLRGRLSLFIRVPSCKPAIKAYSYG